MQQEHKHNRAQVTLDDIAERVGMSRTTVSRALGGHSDVSDRTRQRIEKAARELGYRPHTVARRLATGRSFTICAITGKLPFIRDALFIEVLDVLRRQLTSAGYDLIMGSRDPGVSGVGDAISLIRQQQVDGVVLLETDIEDPLLGRIVEMETPLVLFGRSPEHPELPYVDTDGLAGISTVVEYLARLGHKRIGYIGGPPWAVCAVQRLKGYLKACRSYGISSDGLYIEMDHSGLAEGYSAAYALLNRTQTAPTALICYSDAMAFGAMRAAYELGLRVPDDLSVVGFDNVALDDFTIPKLTSVAQRTRDIGEHLARLILSEVEGEPTNPAQVLLGTELVVRESSKPPQAQGAP